MRLKVERKAEKTTGWVAPFKKVPLRKRIRTKKFWKDSWYYVACIAMVALQVGLFISDPKGDHFFQGAAAGLWASYILNRYMNNRTNDLVKRTHQLELSIERRKAAQDAERRVRAQYED